MVKNLPEMRKTRIQSLGQEYLLRKGMFTHSVVLPGEFHGQRILAGYSLWDPKELDMTEGLTHTERPQASSREDCEPDLCQTEKQVQVEIQGCASKLATYPLVYCYTCICL